jgi:MiaB-like tRNA modifying enzyme
MNCGDSEILLGLATKAGHEVVPDIERSNLVVINTCAVKGTTYRKMLRRLKELKQLNGKRVVVAGCLPLIDLKSIEEIGTFDGIISCKSILKFGEVLNQISQGSANVRELSSETCDRPVAPKVRSSSVTAIVPIAEGCNSRCSYCSVKLARGELESFDTEKIVREVCLAVGAGYREILLTTQDTAAYGLDCGTSLPELLDRLTSIEGRFRIRVGMMNPKNVLPILPELVKAFENEKVYKFLHLPLQSGDDGILEAMKREYTVAEFSEIVGEFRKRIPDLYFCTDVIVGFPGEGEEEFARTYEFIKRTNPDKINISRFSPLPGTEASRLPQVNGREIAARSRMMSELCRELCLRRNLPYVGKEVEGFVIEPGEKGGYILRAENYKPIIITDGELGEFLRVRITEAFPTYLKGVKA